MLGSNEDEGLITRSVNDLFRLIDTADSSKGKKFLVRASYLELYNEIVADLLSVSILFCKVLKCVIIVSFFLKQLHCLLNVF
jgi:hypothetical protein